MVSHNTQVIIFTPWLIGFKGPKLCQENILNTITSTTSSLDCWHKAGWVHGFIPLMLNSDPTTNDPQQKSRITRPRDILLVFDHPVLVSLCPLKPQISVLGWQEWNLMWSLAVVVKRCQGSMCWSFWDAFLLNTLVESGYLSFCNISVSSNQFDHSPLSSLIKTPETLEWKSQENSSFRNTQTTLSHTNVHVKVKFTEITGFLVFDVNIN